jgi:hypothetical protein
MVDSGAGPSKPGYLLAGRGVRAEAHVDRVTNALKTGYLGLLTTVGAQGGSYEKLGLGPYGLPYSIP